MKRNEIMSWRQCEKCGHVGYPAIVHCKENGPANRFRIECEGCHMFLKWGGIHETAELLKRRVDFRKQTATMVRVQNSLPSSMTGDEVFNWIEKAKERRKRTPISQGGYLRT
jgi:hypothetical protein